MSQRALVESASAIVVVASSSNAGKPLLYNR
jgi:hypothetical protein